MADINVKTTTRIPSSAIKKAAKVKRTKPVVQSSIDNDPFLDEDQEDLTSDEAKGLLQSTFQVQNHSDDQEGQDEKSKEIENFEPVDQLMSLNIQEKKNQYEQPMLIEQDENHVDYVVIGCRLPNGVVISLDNIKTLLRGVNDMPDVEDLRCYKGVGFTKVKRSVWKAFIRTHKQWPPLLNGSVFVLNNKDERCDYL